MPRLPQTRDRSTYLGATDIAAIAGVSPWTSPFELYLEKIGELDPRAAESQGDRDRQERGHRLEDVALDWDADLRGLSIERIRRDIVHPRLPFVVVHPDARVKPWTKSRRLLEAKTSARKVDGLPRHWEAQAQVQMAATGADVVDVVVLGFDGPPSVIEVGRNDELIEGLEELATAFWDRVQRRDPPPLDGSRGASRWLDRMFREGPEERADASQADAIARLFAIRDQVKALEAEDDEIVAALKFSMAGASRLWAPKVGRVLWTAPSTRSTVAWKEVAAALRRIVEKTVELAEPRLLQAVADEVHFEEMDDLDVLEQLYTTVAENVRQFRITPAKPAEDADAA